MKIRLALSMFIFGTIGIFVRHIPLPSSVIALGRDMKVTFGMVLLLLVVGIFHTGVAYVLYFSSIKKLQAQTAAIFSYIDPVSAIILSALILKEEMRISIIAGAVMILSSTLLSELSGKHNNGPMSRKSTN